MSVNADLDALRELVAAELLRVRDVFAACSAPGADSASRVQFARPGTVLAVEVGELSAAGFYGGATGHSAVRRRFVKPLPTDAEEAAEAAKKRDEADDKAAKRDEEAAAAERGFREVRVTAASPAPIRARMAVGAV